MDRSQDPQRETAAQSLSYKLQKQSASTQLFQESMKGLKYVVTDGKFPPAVINFIHSNFLSLSDFLLSNSLAIITKKKSQNSKSNLRQQAPDLALAPTQPLAQVPVKYHPFHHQEHSR